MKKADLVPALYLVATPIGNLRDITLRALDVLAGADILACEDTRVTGILLNAHGIRARKIVSYNDHNADRQRPGLLDQIARGLSVALVSDAGTPLVSDPGYKLVRDCLDLGLAVLPVPGPSATLSALQLSGLPSDSFSFAGFLPAKREARRKQISRWLDAPGTLIFFETGPRLGASLADLADILGDRPAAVVREITKIHEESHRAGLNVLAREYQSNTPKGEIVVVIGGAEPKVFAESEIKDRLREALKTSSPRDAAHAVAAQTGLARRAVYNMALAMSRRCDEN